MVLGFSEKFPWGDPTGFPNKILDGIKKTTIRKGNRWKVGDKVHFATGVRTKNYKQFASGKVKQVSKIVIFSSWKRIVIDDDTIIDSGTDIMNVFVMNEGFENEDQFWKWFNEDLKGQYIVWELDR